MSELGWRGSKQVSPWREKYFPEFSSPVIVSPVWTEKKSPTLRDFSNWHHLQMGSREKNNKISINKFRFRTAFLPRFLEALDFYTFFHANTKVNAWFHSKGRRKAGNLKIAIFFNAEASIRIVLSREHQNSDEYLGARLAECAKINKVPILGLNRTSFKYTSST